MASKMNVAILVLVLLLLSAVVTVCVERYLREPLRQKQATQKVISEVAYAIERYRSDHDSWPPVAEGHSSGIIDDQSFHSYIREWPDDGWRVPLRYALPDGRPEIRSAGADRKFGTQDDFIYR